MSEVFKELDRAEELLCKGMKEINDRNELDAATLDNLKDAIEGVEKIYKTRHFASEDNVRNGYSQTYRYDGGSRYPYMTYPMYHYGTDDYDTNHSHGYRNNYDNRYDSGNSYGYDNGYSRGSMLEHLEHALKDAKTEHEREAIRRIISERS